MLCARGIVGAEGRITLIDTESRRGEIYEDIIPGGYNTIRFDEPFTPARYVEAIQLAEKQSDIIIIDSVSHEWEGISGVLDMAAANEERSGKAGLHNWKSPKLEHNKMLRRMLQSPLPMIVCMRAKHKSRQVKENGKTVIVKDEFTSPIQSEDFIFEMTTHGEIMPDHSYRLTKPVHPSLDTCFPVLEPITIATGEAIAKWCEGVPSAPLADDIFITPAQAQAFIATASGKGWKTAGTKAGG